jgi:hypothetical protein
MSISKDYFITKTGGFLWGELNALRFAEIQVLEARLRSGKYSEQDHRRLCELKDISFDAYDVEDHPNA